MYSKIIFLFIAVASLAACDVKTKGATDAPPVEKIQATDGVKLISDGDENPRNQEAYQQLIYKLNSTSRLLVRYELLASQANRPASKEPIYLRLFVTANTAQSFAQGHLRVCPVLKNWMMMATWKRAHPFPSGSWVSGGGDIALDECVSFDPGAASKATGCAKDGALCFNILDWYQAFIVERQVNYGVALIADDTVEIFGDAAGAKGPRIHWYELP